MSPLRFVRRSLRRERGSFALAVVTLAGGIGVAATLATLVHDIVLRPFPFTTDDTVFVWATDPGRDVPHLEVSWADVAALREGAETLVGVTAWSAANFGVVLSTSERPVQLQGNVVATGFFELLGVEPAAGRFLSAEEQRPGGPPAAVLSHEAWRRHFGGDPAVIGRTVPIDGEPWTLIGVVPAGVDLPRGAEVLLPLEPFQTGDEASRRNRVLVGAARLAPGATVAAAAAEASAVLAALERGRERGSKTLGARLEPFRASLLGGTRPALLATLAMSFLVLAVALLNVAGLRLHQLLGRRRELALRAALGAGRGDLGRLLAAESALVVATAGVLGCGLAALLLRAFTALAPGTLPRRAEVAFGPETVAWCGLAAFAALLLLGALPAAAGDRAGAPSLLRGGERAGRDRAGRRALDGVAAGQLALAVVLLVAAGLTAASFRAWTAIDPGFATDGVVTAHVALPYTLGEEPEVRRGELRRLLDRVRALPGVEAAGSVLMRPLEMELGWDYTFTVAGQDFAAQETNPLGNLLAATPGYFEAMATPVLAGRTFLEGDRAEARPVAVVGEGLARRFWGSPGGALGQRLKSGRPDAETPWLTVVGVVADGRYRGLEVEKLDVYVPYGQSHWSPNYLAVRVTEGDPAALVPALERAVAAVFPEVPLARARTTRDLVAAELAAPRLHALVLGLFGVAAVSLAALGLYGVLAYGVRLRRRELAVRAALGAGRRALVALVLRRAALVAGAGTAAGLLLALPALPPIAERLYGVGGEVRWATVGVAAAAVAAVALVSSLVPARRAAAADPAAALREE